MLLFIRYCGLSGHRLRKSTIYETFGGGWFSCKNIWKQNHHSWPILVKVKCSHIYIPCILSFISEYDPINPPKLNEKVLKDKRKKLKETFQRVVHLYVSMIIKTDQKTVVVLYFMANCLVWQGILFVFCSVTSIILILCLVSHALFPLFHLQEKEDPEYSTELRKAENEYDKKRLQMQIYYGNDVQTKWYI